MDATESELYTDAYDMIMSGLYREDLQHALKQEKAAELARRLERFVSNQSNFDILYTIREAISYSAADDFDLTSRLLKSGIDVFAVTCYLMHDPVLVVLDAFIRFAMNNDIPRGANLDKFVNTSYFQFIDTFDNMPRQLKYNLLDYQIRGHLRLETRGGGGLTMYVPPTKHDELDKALWAFIGLASGVVSVDLESSSSAQVVEYDPQLATPSAIGSNHQNQSVKIRLDKVREGLFQEYRIQRDDSSNPHFHILQVTRYVHLDEEEQDEIQNARVWNDYRAGIISYEDLIFILDELNGDDFQYVNVEWQLAEVMYVRTDDLMDYRHPRFFSSRRAARNANPRLIFMQNQHETSPPSPGAAIAALEAIDANDDDDQEMEVDVEPLVRRRLRDDADDMMDDVEMEIATLPLKRRRLGAYHGAV